MTVVIERGGKVGAAGQVLVAGATSVNKCIGMRLMVCSVIAVMRPLVRPVVRPVVGAVVGTVVRAVVPMVRVTADSKISLNAALEVRLEGVIVNMPVDVSVDGASS